MMLKTIQERNIDKQQKLLNGHWHTVSFREKREYNKLPHANMIAHKEGMIFNDYVGQNTSLNSFKTLQQIEIGIHYSLYDRIQMRIVKMISYQPHIPIEFTLFCHNGRLTKVQLKVLHLLGYEIEFYFDTLNKHRKKVKVFTSKLI